METEFTKNMAYFNNLINRHEKGSKMYRLLCKLKYKYIKDFI